MSLLVPTIDLAPSVSSRLVTIRVTDLPEGGPLREPGSVTFTLPGDLRVAADDVIIRAGSVTVELDANGYGEVRLPAHDPDAQGDGVGSDWYLLLSKSWSQQIDMIRVPMGSGSISLADIAPVVEVSPAMGQWLITNAAVSVVEGAQWGATVTVSGGVATFRFTVPPGGVAFDKGALATAVVLNDVRTPGLYATPGVPPDWQAQGFPTTERGWLLVGEMGSSSFFQLWITLNTAAPKLYLRIGTTTSWGLWIEVGRSIIRPFVPGSTDLDTVTEDGDYPLIATVTDWEAQHYPANVRGHLSVRRANAWVFQTVRSNVLASPQHWERVYNTAWSDWVELGGGGAGGVGSVSLRHQLLVDELLAVKGGPIGTGGAAPVALTFDDYPRDFRDYMLAGLRSRGIPYTLALSSRMYDAEALSRGGTWEAVYNGAQGTTWAEIAGWLDADGSEVANHSATHNGGSGNAYLRAEIEQGRIDLEAALGRRVWSWVQPSATYVDDSGAAFNNGDSLEAYADHYAGQLVVNQHAIATGVRLVNGLFSVPRFGVPFQGLNRTWISSASNIAATQARIQAASAAGQGVIVGSHGRDIPDALITQAEFDAFLDWLVVERDAGRIRLLLLSEWAIADTRLAV